MQAILLSYSRNEMITTEVTEITGAFPKSGVYASRAVPGGLSKCRVTMEKSCGDHRVLPEVSVASVFPVVNVALFSVIHF